MERLLRRSPALARTCSVRCALVVTVVLAAAVAFGGVAQAAPLPNVVVVMVDDMPALDGRLLMALPNTRALAGQGLTFANFHSETPLCCPARAGFLTGQHTVNHGVLKNEARTFKPGMTLATQLRARGYFTLLTGKYLNAYTTVALKGGMPPGWDRMAAFGDPAYYNYDLFVGGSATPVHYGATDAEYSTTVLQQYTLDYLRQAPPTKPIFAWVALNAPHTPTTPAPRHATAPCDVPKWAPPNYMEADVGDKPAYVRGLPLANPGGRSLLKLCRALLAVDDTVGAIRDELARQRRLSNTIFVITGDNGMNSGEHRLVGKEAPYTTDIPFYLSWPSRLGTAPRTITERVQNIDFPVTICAVVGCTLGPYPGGQLRPDGISFAPLVFGTAVSLHRDAVLESLPFAVGVGAPAWFSVDTTSSSFLGLWQYTEYATGERELYDMSGGPCYAWVAGMPGDPCQLLNLVANPAFGGIATALHDRLALLKVERG
jgi:arylsulfatase A-like enzyme